MTADQNRPHLQPASLQKPSALRLGDKTQLSGLGGRAVGVILRLSVGPYLIPVALFRPVDHHRLLTGLGQEADRLESGQHAYVVLRRGPAEQNRRSGHPIPP